MNACESPRTTMLSIFTTRPHNVGLALKCCYRNWLRRHQSTDTTGQHTPLRILFFGSDAFSLGTLTRLLLRMRDPIVGRRNIECIDVITSESPLFVKGKKSQKLREFVDYAKKNNLKIYKWDKAEISTKAKEYDFGVVASFGNLIPKAVIKSFRRGIINAHPSLLPRWRGAAPIIHTVLSGDRKTGVTIIDLSVGRFDRGKIFTQKQIDIDQAVTTETLTEVLAELAGEMALDVIENFDDYQENKISQPDSGGTYAPKISSDMSYVKWNTDSCDYIDRLHRAIGEKIGVHTFWRDKLVKFFKLGVLDKAIASAFDTTTSSSYTPGKIVYDKESRSLFIKCADGWIKVSKLQVEYKKPITGADFYNAYMVDRKTKTIHYDEFS